jgi:hypothetical protein
MFRKLLPTAAKDCPNRPPVLSNEGEGKPIDRMIRNIKEERLSLPRPET